MRAREEKELDMAEIYELTFYSQVLDIYFRNAVNPSYS